MLNGATDYVLKNKLERLVPAIKRAIHEHQLEVKRIQAKQKLKEKNNLIEAQNLKYVQINKELTESLHHTHIINDELIVSKNKAEESDKLKSAFLANMSHEVRTPLNAIIGFSGLLLEPAISKEELAEFVQIIKNNSVKLLSIINDIMDISKIETDQFTVNSDLVDVNKLLNELFVSYRIQVGSNNIELLCPSINENKIIEIRTDRNRIKQILSNLLNNAIKFTNEGKIEFGYNVKEKFIEFFVKDTGLGIELANQALVFDRFRQVDAAKNKINSGNGLGLSISKALVEKLGGSITIDSELGKGSIFMFTIPHTSIFA